MTRIKNRFIIWGDNLLHLYPIYEYQIAASQLAFTMLGMGAALKINDFINIFKNPKSLFIGIFCQLIIVPAVAYLAISILDIHPGVVMGIIMIAAIPGGTTSNLFTYLSKGNAALSISLTSIVTLGCLFTTPLILTVIASQYLPPDFSMPVLLIIREIIVFLLFPLGLGMYIGNKFKKIRDSFSKWCIRFAIITIVIMVVGALGSGRIKIMEYGISMPVFITCFSLAIFIISLLITYITNLSSKDGVAVGIEILLRNSNLGLLIGVSIFPAEGPTAIISAGVVYTTLYYGGNNVLAGLMPMIIHRKMVKSGTTNFFSFCKNLFKK